MKQKNILVVEDDVGIRDAIVEFLRDEGFHASGAANGKEALQFLAQEQRPCLILLDWMMPIMNGLEFLKARANRDKLGTIPVVVVSAVAEKAKGFPGVAATVKKPIDLNMILEAIQTHCSHESAAA